MIPLGGHSLATTNRFLRVSAPFQPTAIIIVPGVLMYLTLPFCPESPKFILIIQGKDVNAQKALTWLRGTIEVRCFRFRPFLIVVMIDEHFG